MRQTAIGFKSKSSELEGVLSTPEGLPPPYPALLVCHPLPTLGGDMNNPVVMAVCRSVDTLGLASLRFNYRGVNGSEGEFSETNAIDDVRSALNVLRRWPGVDRKRIALAGYSFSAGAILRGLRKYRVARSLALIAPPISAVDDSRIRKDKRPKLFVVGQNDRIVSSVALQRALDEVRQPVQFRELPGANHSLRGYERQAAEHVAVFVAQTLGVSGV